MNDEDVPLMMVIALLSGVIFSSDIQHNITLLQERRVSAAEDLCVLEKSTDHQSHLLCVYHSEPVRAFPRGRCCTLHKNTDAHAQTRAHRPSITPVCALHKNTDAHAQTINHICSVHYTITQTRTHRHRHAHTQTIIILSSITAPTVNLTVQLQTPSTCEDAAVSE